MRIRVYNPRETYRPNPDHMVKNLFAAFERDFNDRWGQFDKLFEQLNKTIKERPITTVYEAEVRPRIDRQTSEELHDIRRQIEEIKAVIIPQRFQIKRNKTNVKLTVISSI